MNEAQRNCATPEFLCLETLLKARPSEEGGERFIYLEASREGADQQNEYVLAKALEDSAEHFLKFGNIDIDHKSMAPIAKMYGIENPETWEVGVPEDVRVDGQSVLVKARLFKGDTPLAAKANMVWDSMTKLNPAARWYASVGGATLAKAAGVDPATNNKVNFVTKVRWSNLAISRQPVNQHVSAATTVPFGALAKCWTPDGFDMFKALEASYATDAVGKTGGAAFGQQSLDTGGQQPHSYYGFRNKLAAAMKSKELTDMTMPSMIAFSTQKFNLAPNEAAEWVDRFLGDLKSSLSNRSTK
ncbi:hypothetical protein [Pseudomonas sp.]|uniref:hypothetical protein n=1 Tax=Pseudomonas sp. TaxID=306 RepID=UPI003FD83A53